ncbi:MAG: hypothetical protein RR649_05970, partial [Carnobacterium sp.]
NTCYSTINYHPNFIIHPITSFYTFIKTAASLLLNCIITVKFMKIVFAFMLLFFFQWIIIINGIVIFNGVY